MMPSVTLNKITNVSGLNIVGNIWVNVSKQLNKNVYITLVHSL